MNQKKEIHPMRDGFITAIAFGGFLVIVGMLFALTPDLWQKITNFFNNITMKNVFLGISSSTVYVPVPLNPAAHQELYAALLQFDVAFGLLQILILALRLWTKSATRRIAETLGNAVFWLGASALVSAFLMKGTLNGWFEYWTALIMVVGVSMIARAIVFFLKK